MNKKWNYLFLLFNYTYPLSPHVNRAPTLLHSLLLCCWRQANSEIYESYKYSEPAQSSVANESGANEEADAAAICTGNSHPNLIENFARRMLFLKFCYRCRIELWHYFPG